MRTRTLLPCALLLAAAQPACGTPPASHDGAPGDAPRADAIATHDGPAAIDGARGLDAPMVDDTAIPDGVAPLDDAFDAALDDAFDAALDAARPADAIATDGGDGGAPSARADFFVAPTGRDTWSGTLATPNASGTDGPFASLAAAQSAVRSALARAAGRTAPIVVDVRAGTYALAAPWTLGAADSGTATVRVVWQAYPGETPVISGGVALRGFTQPSPGRWQLDTPSLAPFTHLYVNGARRDRARTTAAGYLYNAGPVYQPTASSACPTMTASGYECFDRFRYANTDLDPAWTHLSDVEVIDFEQWTVARMRLRSIDAANHIAYLTGSTYTNTWHGFILHHRYLVENVAEALDRPGEWYRDGTTGRLTYLALPGEDPATATVVAPQQGQLLVASAGLAHVTFRGLTFAFANWTVPAAGHPSGQGEANVPAALSFTGANDVVLAGCTIAHVAGWALEFEGATAFAPTAAAPWSAQLVDSVLTDVGTGGARVGRGPAGGDTDASVPHHVYLANNAIGGVGRTLPAGPGVWIGNAHHVTVEHNEIYDAYNTGVSVGFSFDYSACLAHDDAVQFNHIHDLGQGVTNDMGGVYTLVAQTTGNVIQNNRIHDVTHDPGNPSVSGSAGYGGWGVYLDQGSSNVAVRDNLVFRALDEPYKQNSGHDDVVTNNIFAFGGHGSVHRQFFQASDPTVLGMTFRHNIWLEDTVTRFAVGDWQCVDASSNPAPCTTRFLFASNLYGYPAGGPTFALNGPHPGTYTFAQWQSTLGEDTGSVVAAPMFTNPYPPADDFSLRAGSPAIGVGFVPFDLSAPGRLAGAPPLPTAPPAFPPQVPPLSAY